MSFKIVICLCLGLSVGAFAGEKEKIVGGADADIKDFPYQASLRLIKGNKHYCGGTIISDRHILTAAHCVVDILTPPYTRIAVYTGSSSSRSTNGPAHKIERADVHPGYTGTQISAYHNDIAVITLKEPIEFNEYQNKINLPSRDVRTGDNAIVTGWGIQKYPSKIAAVQLQKAPMKIVSSFKCQLYLGTPLHSEQVCALLKKGVGVCSGDSGGPLAIDGEVVGVTSFVIPCGKGLPDVYTKVYDYLDFIKSIVEK